MSVTLSPESFSKQVLVELLSAVPKIDVAIQELVQQIVQEKLAVQNTEIRYIRGRTDITARFSKNGRLTYLSRFDKGTLFNSNFKITFPDRETPGALEKYKWIQMDPLKMENIFHVQPQLTNSDAVILGLAGLAALSCLVALPVIKTGALVLGLATIILAPVMIMTADIAASIIAITAIVTSPLIAIGFLFAFI